jgi:hypothetical protein
MNTSEEDRSVYNGHFEVEVLVDRSVEQVWSQYLDIGSWITSHDIANAFGTPGTVGSTTRVSIKGAKELGMPPAHHHYCKIVKLVPERQYLIKTYSEKGGSYGWQFIAFDDTRFVEMERGTKIVFNFFSQHKAESVPKDWAVLQQGLETSREGMLSNLNNLKRIVEGR